MRDIGTSKIPTNNVLCGEERPAASLIGNTKNEPAEKIGEHGKELSVLCSQEHNITSKNNIEVSIEKIQQSSNSLKREKRTTKSEDESNNKEFKVDSTQRKREL